MIRWPVGFGLKLTRLSFAFQPQMDGVAADIRLLAEVGKRVRGQGESGSEESLSL